MITVTEAIALAKENDINFTRYFIYKWIREDKENAIKVGRIWKINLDLFVKEIKVWQGAAAIRRVFSYWGEL